MIEHSLVFTADILRVPVFQQLLWYHVDMIHVCQRQTPRLILKTDGKEECPVAKKRWWHWTDLPLHRWKVLGTLLSLSILKLLSHKVEVMKVPKCHWVIVKTEGANLCKAPRTTITQ